MRKMIVLFAAVTLLTGCGGSATTTATSPLATGTAPKAEQTAWAGKVCTATVTLQKDAQGLVSVATSGGSDVASTLSAQAAAVKISVTNLATTITAVPRGTGGGSDLAAVKASADGFTKSFTGLEVSVAALAGTSGPSKVIGLVTVGSAADTALSRLTAMAAAIKAAAKDGKGTIGQAFKAAPSCRSLTS